MKKIAYVTINSYIPPKGEVVSTKSDLIPGQAYSIGELLERATRGQRLNVPMRKPDLLADDGTQYDEKNYRKEGDMDFNDTPADIQDRVEFDAYRAEHEARKRAFAETIAKLKKQKEDADEQAKRREKKDDADPTPTK